MLLFFELVKKKMCAGENTFKMFRIYNGCTIRRVDGEKR